MPPLKSYLDVDLLKQLLDIYYELTGISIAFYTTPNEEPIYSNKNWPKFCRMANSIIGQIVCNVDYGRLKTKGLYQCKAGLWCYSYPLIINEIFIGAFIVGHRPLKGEEEESIKVLKKTLKEYRINEEKSNVLLDLLSKEKSTEKDSFIGFDIKLLEKLSFIESYVTLEHQRSSKEHEKIIAFKNEAESLAHEFLLPIQSIVADAEKLMVISSEAKIFEVRNLSEDILQEIRKLSFIAENIRVSVIETELKIEFESVDVIGIIFETVNLFRKEASNKNVKITIKITDIFKQEGQNIIAASEPHIKQLFFNLIHNAVKYSYSSTDVSDRYISVTCDTFKNMFICEVSNFGIGILPDEIEQKLIFQKGYRGRLSRDRKRIGSGFGLFKVMEIIKAHSGGIEVESTKVGTGSKIDPYVTTFKIKLPYKQPKK